MPQLSHTRVFRHQAVVLASSAPRTEWAATTIRGAAKDRSLPNMQRGLLALPPYAFSARGGNIFGTQSTILFALAITGLKLFP